jgi:hypothetical protein
MEHNMNVNPIAKPHGHQSSAPSQPTSKAKQNDTDKKTVAAATKIASKLQKEIEVHEMKNQYVPQNSSNNSLISKFINQGTPSDTNTMLNTMLMPTPKRKESQRDISAEELEAFQEKAKGLTELIESGKALYPITRFFERKIMGKEFPVEVVAYFRRETKGWIVTLRDPEDKTISHFKAEEIIRDGLGCTYTIKYENEVVRRKTKKTSEVGLKITKTDSRENSQIDGSDHSKSHSKSHSPAASYKHTTISEDSHSDSEEGIWELTPQFQEAWAGVFATNVIYSMIQKRRKPLRDGFNETAIARSGVINKDTTKYFTNCRYDVSIHARQEAFIRSIIEELISGERTKKSSTQKKEEVGFSEEDKAAFTRLIKAAIIPTQKGDELSKSDKDVLQAFLQMGSTRTLLEARLQGLSTSFDLQKYLDKIGELQETLNISREALAIYKSSRYFMIFLFKHWATLNSSEIFLDDKLDWSIGGTADLNVPSVNISTPPKRTLKMVMTEDNFEKTKEEELIEIANHFLFLMLKKLGKQSMRSLITAWYHILEKTDYRTTTVRGFLNSFLGAKDPKIGRVCLEVLDEMNKEDDLHLNEITITVN